jgi:hypothetical protein
MPPARMQHGATLRFAAPPSTPYVQLGHSSTCLTIRSLAN